MFYKIQHIIYQMKQKLMNINMLFTNTEKLPYCLIPQWYDPKNLKKHVSQNGQFQEWWCQYSLEIVHEYNNVSEPVVYGVGYVDIVTRIFMC